MVTVLFFGTSTFAVPSLERLAANPRFRILAVITQPDRPAGRKATLTEPPVKTTAKRLGLAIHQFEHIKSDEAFAILKTYAADLGVVASYGQILPPRILTLPTHGMVNVHGSLLPKYRGASPIAATILHGDQETGVTFMEMDERLDHGNTFGAVKTSVAADETADSLHDRLAALAADALPAALIDYLDGRSRPMPQDHARATFTKILSREDGRIDWNGPSAKIERMVRAFNPWPECYTERNGRRIKIHRARIGASTRAPAGTWSAENGWPAVACGDGKTLMLERVQPEGRPPMDGASFLRGQRSILPPASETSGRADDSNTA